MNNPRLDPTAQFVCGVRDFVRGREQELIEELKPLVQSQSVRLDLSGISRIDAAGLAALVSLHCEAFKAGHEFTVFNPSRQVARILALVGLDHILLWKDSAETRAPAPMPDLVAA